MFATGQSSWNILCITLAVKKTKKLLNIYGCLIFSLHIIFASMDAIRNNFGEFYPVHLLYVFPYVHYPFYRWASRDKGFYDLPGDVVEAVGTDAWCVQRFWGIFMYSFFLNDEFFLRGIKSFWWFQDLSGCQHLPDDQRGHRNDLLLIFWPVRLRAGRLGW